MRDIITAKEGETITINIKGTWFELCCAQKESPHPQLPFQKVAQWTTLRRAPTAEEANPVDQPFVLTQLTNRAKRQKTGTRLPRLPSSLVETLFRSINSVNMKILDNAGLKRQYTNLGILGSGGEGTVYKVRNLAQNREMALKIANAGKSYPRDVLALVNYLLDTEQTPHLTRTYNVHCVLKPLEGLPREQDEDFFNDKGLEGSRTINGIGIEMELLEGDISEFMESCRTPDIQKTAIKLQMVFTKLLINHYYFSALDSDCWRNILFKKLTPDDTFKGKPLAEYDYWKYSHGGLTVYLPKLPLVIKFGDYDQWGGHLFHDYGINLADESSSLEAPAEVNWDIIFKNYPFEMTLKEIEELFPKPEDPNAKILDMTPML